MNNTMVLVLVVVVVVVVMVMMGDECSNSVSKNP